MKISNGYGEYLSLKPIGAADYTETDSGYTIDTDQDFDVIFPVDKSTKHWSLSMTTNAAHDGTTSAYALYYSVDGVNYVALKDIAGNAITGTVATDSTYVINSNGVYASGLIKMAYDKGNAAAATGTMTVSLSYGD